MSTGPTDWLLIARDVVCQAFPGSIAMAAQQLMYVNTVAFVGSLHDEAELAACGVGTMISNVFGLSIGIGLNSGLDTLVAQSCGAGNHSQSGVFLHRAILVSTIACIPITIGLHFVTPVLIFLRQDPLVSRLAGDFIHGTLFSMWAMLVANAMNAFLRAQRLPNVPAYLAWVSNAIHVCMCYIFIVRWRMGNFGAGLAISVTNWCGLALVVSIVHFCKPGLTKQSWVRWRWRQAVSNLGAFLSVSLPSAFAIWAEWWCAELMTLLAGLLGATALAAHTAVIAAFCVLYCIGGGVQAAASTLVGNAVGADCSERARRCALVSIIVVAVTLVLMNSVSLAFEESIAALLSGTEVVKEQVIRVFSVMLLMMSLDSMQTVIDGILRGLGKQALMFKIKMCTMWMIRMPAAILSVSFIGTGIVGLWWASALGMMASLSTYVMLLWRMNWLNEVQRASSQQKRRESLETNLGDIALQGA
mmetsp:Transcript_107603/g.213785  ORF Transcript_107603/g.213785 Transcript_107603/m.213785 type:complete len:473 (+) Transcript_107603:67-1485(+)